MKILMLTDVFFPDTVGGAGRMAFYLCRALSARGHEVHVMTRGRSGDNLPAFQKPNPGLWVYRFRVPIRESLNFALHEVYNSRHLAQQLSQRIDFDLICTHQTLAALGPLSLPALAAKPLLHCYYSPWHTEFFIKKHDTPQGPKLKDRILPLFLRWLEKRQVGRSDRVMVLSEYSRAQVTTLHHYPAEKIALVPGCVDLDRFQLPFHNKSTIKSRLRLPLTKKIFLTVRNLVPRMGLENLIQSFASSAILRNQALLLIGGKGFLEAHLKSLVAQERLQACIQFLGFIPENLLIRYYQAADFFVLPTKKLEGFGLVILEALACGTPVLGTPVGAIPELLAPFSELLVMEGNSSPAMRQKLEETVLQTDKYVFDPEACRDYVQKHYNWSRVSAAYEKLVLDTIR